MNATQLRRIVLLGLAALLPFAAMGDDTDIYIENDAPPGSKPLVMFSLDYRPNLTATLCNNAAAASCTQAEYFRTFDDDLKADVVALGTDKFYFFDMIRLALKVVLKSKELSGRMKVGFMMSHNQDNNCAGFTPSPTCSNGGVIMRGFKEILENDSNQSVKEFAKILAQLRTLKSGANSADHPYQGAELFFEYYRYLRGFKISDGHNGVHDFESGGNRTNANMDIPQYAPASWDTEIEDDEGLNYVSPLTGTACSKLYTVNFFFGNSQSDTDTRDLMNKPIVDGGFDKASNDPIGNNSAFADVVNYLHANDIGALPYVGTDVQGEQSVRSYFLYDGNLANVVDNLAFKGGTNKGILIGNDPEQLVETLVAIFREVLATSTTFVAASVPVNVFNRASAVDNVYIAIFQADKDGLPFWPGNLKKLKIGGTTDNPELMDARSGTAVGLDGRIRATSLTYWTQNFPTSLLPADTVNTPPENDLGRDGKKVPLGGAGQKIPGFLPVAGVTNPGIVNGDGKRQLYYLDTASNTLKNLDATDANAILLRDALKVPAGTDAIRNAEAKDLLFYIRGFNDAHTGVRPWIMGDPLHSRPRPINYGKCCGHTTTANPAIYIAIGGNDGFMRLFENTTGGGVESGTELWGFMPPEAMASLRPAPNDHAVQKILKANIALTDPKHPVTVDGAPIELIVDNDRDGNVEAGNGDQVLLFFGLRRGGSAYYALDVTNPRVPSLKWRITNSGDFSELGLSFSTPRIGKVPDIDGDGLPDDALFFSGGYDINKDAHALGTNDTLGKAIYVVNAKTGILIWKATGGTPYGSSLAEPEHFRHPDLLDSIPSDLTIADTDGDGLTDRIVVGDTGGNVWRADVNTGAVAGWKLTLLAKLGRHAIPGDRVNDRRFFHEPDVVQTKDELGNSFDAVLIGSGDRENPLDKPRPPEPPPIVAPVNISNYFYMIRDNAITPGAAKDSRASASVTDRTHDDIKDLTTINCAMAGAPASSCASSSLVSGWKLLLEESREKSLAAPLTFSGTVFFTSYVPKDRALDTCAPKEGNGKLYAVDLKNAAPLFQYYDADDSSLAITDRATNLESPGIPAQVVFVPGYGKKSILRPDLTFGEAPGSNRFRTFWQRVNQ